MDGELEFRIAPSETFVSIVMLDEADSWYSDDIMLGSTFHKSDIVKLRDVLNGLDLS